MPLGVVNVLTTKGQSCPTYFAVVSFNTTRNAFTFGAFVVFVVRPLFSFFSDVAGPSSEPVGVTSGAVVAGVGVVGIGTVVGIIVEVAGSGSSLGLEVRLATGSESLDDLEARLPDGPEIGVGTWICGGISTLMLTLRNINTCGLKTDTKAYSFRPDRGLVCTKVCSKWGYRVAFKHTHLCFRGWASPR